MINNIWKQNNFSMVMYIYYILFLVCFHFNFILKWIGGHSKIEKIIRISEASHFKRCNNLLCMSDFHLGSQRTNRKLSWKIQMKKKKQTIPYAYKEERYNNMRFSLVLTTYREYDAFFLFRKM